MAAVASVASRGKPTARSLRPKRGRKSRRAPGRTASLTARARRRWRGGEPSVIIPIVDLGKEPSSGHRPPFSQK